MLISISCVTLSNPGVCGTNPMIPNQSSGPFNIPSSWMFSHRITFSYWMSCTIGKQFSFRPDCLNIFTIKVSLTYLSSLAYNQIKPAEHQHVSGVTVRKIAPWCQCLAQGAVQHSLSAVSPVSSHSHTITYCWLPTLISSGLGERSLKQTLQITDNYHHSTYLAQ